MYHVTVEYARNAWLILLSSRMILLSNRLNLIALSTLFVVARHLVYNVRQYSTRARRMRHLRKIPFQKSTFQSLQKSTFQSIKKYFSVTTDNISFQIFYCAYDLQQYQSSWSARDTARYQG